MRYLLSILGLVVVIGGLSAVKFSQISKLIGFGDAMKAAGPPPETVATSSVRKQSWNDGIEAIASVVAARGVTLSNDAPGIVSRLSFDSGTTVKQGQVLVELDSSVERAQLASLRAKSQLATITLARSRTLVESGTISKATLEADEANYQGLLADEKALSAQIARKVVRAPFSGKLGLRAVNLGQYLSPGTPITVLESERTTYIDFTVPQSKLGELALKMPVVAYDQDSKIPIARGLITAIEPNVDSITRNLKVRASVEDEKQPLLPGMFLKVQVEKPNLREVTTVPATAIVHASYGDSVFCVEAAKTDLDKAPQRQIARQKFVKVGESRGDYVAILDGVSAGEEVVTLGAFKLRNGVPVVINNDVRLEPELLPRPDNR